MMIADNYNQKKAELRKEYTKKRNDLSISKIKLFSGIISDKIINNPNFKKASNILAYIPFKNEVDIRMVIDTAWNLNKKVLIPKTDLSKKIMLPYEINSWQELESGNFQLLEPVVDNKGPFPITEIELVLVPGLVFDMNGYRLGYGGGYYDRFFTVCKSNLYKLGIAYDFQIIDQIPVHYYDYPVNEIITEKQSITVK